MHNALQELLDEGSALFADIPFVEPATRESLVAFADTFFPHYFPDPPSKFHQWLTPRLQALIFQSGQKINVIAPRGSAKSTWITFVYPLYCAAYGLEEHIVIYSETQGLARQHLRTIKLELERNDTLREAFPHLNKGDTWQADRITLRNGTVIQSYSRGTNIRGMREGHVRPSLVIIDDPQGKEVFDSATIRDKDLRWLKQEVLEAGSPETNYLVVGTTLHTDCIVCSLQTTPGWQSHVFRSIIDFPQRVDLWDEWAGLYTDHRIPEAERESAALQFYTDRQTDMDAGANVLWPERFPLYDLMVKRLSNGVTAFNFEHQALPINPDTVEWPPEYFDRADIWFDAWPRDLVVKTIYLDPSKGQNDTTHDYQAFILYGRDRKGIEYVEADLRKQDVAAMVGTAVEHVRLFKPDGFGIEAIAWQDLIAPEFTRQAKAAGLELHAVLKLMTDMAPKHVRIRRLTPMLSQRRVRFKARSPGTALLVKQMQEFPNASHDDGPDALEGARRLAIDLDTKRRV